MQIPSPISKRKARIEIIPLIDIMFFLLATFVMVSMSMVKNLGVTVKLPVAKTSAPVEQQDYTAITITESGDLTWNKEAIKKQELIARLNGLKVTDPDAKIFINGDAKTSFENVIFVLDEARQLGFTKIAIQTVKP